MSKLGRTRTRVGVFSCTYASMTLALMTLLPVTAVCSAQTTPPSSAQPAASAVDPDLLLRFAVNTGAVSGDTITDQTGTITAKIVGAPVKNTIGPGEGYRFNGLSDWLVIADDIAKSPRGLPKREFTVAAWVCMHKTTEYGSIIGVTQDNGAQESGWTLGYSHDGFYFALATKGADDGDGTLTYLKSTKGVNENRWSHVVGTYDGRSMKLYVNGELHAQSTEQSGEILYPASAPYTIGCYKDRDEEHAMNATLLEVKVLGRALAPVQVTEEFVPGVRLTSFQPTEEATQRFVVKPYLQFATQTTMTFVWETSKAGTGVIEFGQRLPYEMKSVPGPSGTLHEITLTDLKPQTPYFYRAVTTSDDGTIVASDDLTFQTAVLEDAPYAFTVIGDTQKNKPVIEKLNTFAFSLRPNFQIHLGDVVDKGPDRSEWIDELLPASWPLMSRVCMYPSIGNHEENHSNYYKYFALPDQEYRYTYRYGNAQLFSIDTNKPVTPGSEQYQWLERELAKSTATWKFAYHHHPVYSSDENDYGNTYKEASAFGDMKVRPLAALYEKYKVDINFNGHIHSYERSWPIKDGKIDEQNGVMYITSGGGGGGLESAGPSRSWFARRVYRGHHLCYVMIYNKTLTLQTFDLEGRLIDQMEIKKP